MRTGLIVILLVVLLTASGLVAAAQSSKGNANAAQAAEELRSQLLEVEAKEAELQNRVRQLDEDLKPENIQRSLAGVGSTKPEELRELRRRQLTIERDRVQAQLKLLATSRERLESTVRFAETQAYLESAEATGAPLQMLKLQSVAATRVATGILMVLALLGLAFGIAAVRRVLTVEGRNPENPEIRNEPRIDRKLVGS
jgi:uncharacterized protein YlxW (UPF0749 family)